MTVAIPGTSAGGSTSVTRWKRFCGTRWSRALTIDERDLVRRSGRCLRRGDAPEASATHRTRTRTRCPPHRRPPPTPARMFLARSASTSGGLGTSAGPRSPRVPGSQPPSCRARMAPSNAHACAGCKAPLGPAAATISGDGTTPFAMCRGEWIATGQEGSDREGRRWPLDRISFETRVNDSLNLRVDPRQGGGDRHVVADCAGVLQTSNRERAAVLRRARRARAPARRDPFARWLCPPTTCSGAMYAGVPAISPIVHSPLGTARPKSRILMRPRPSTMMFDGLRSRCRTPRSWAAANPAQSCLRHVERLLGRQSADAAQERLERLAVDQLHRDVPTSRRPRRCRTRGTRWGG